MTHRPLVAITISALVAVTATGCGKSRAPTDPGYNPAVAQTLQHDLAGVDRYLKAGNSQAGREALKTLADDTLAAQKHGQLAAARATSILRAQTQLASDLQPDTPPSTSPVQPAATPTAAATPVPARPAPASTTPKKHPHGKHGDGEGDGGG